MGQDLSAGSFSAWITQMQGALRGEHASDVPCGECTACCTASQFIHIEPDETDTLSHVPAELLFAAPRLPRGHVLMGYDQHGHCPMLIDGACSIYQHRPRTCRTYDCRVFPAAGLEVDDEAKVLIAQQTQRWRFEHPTQADLDRHDAVRAAARFLDEHRDALPAGAVPSSTTQLAVLGVELHQTFLTADGSGPDLDEVRVRLTRPSDRPSGPRADSRGGTRRGRARPA